jgi:hypothetical protein
VAPERDLEFSALHELCAPVADSIAALPAPQENALASALGLVEGSPDDRFLLGRAVHSLLAEKAHAGPLVCVIDDAHWIDRPSRTCWLSSPVGSIGSTQRDDGPNSPNATLLFLLLNRLRMSRFF